MFHMILVCKKIKNKNKKEREKTQNTCQHLAGVVECAEQAARMPSRTSSASDEAVPLEGCSGWQHLEAAAIVGAATPCAACVGLVNK